MERRFALKQLALVAGAAITLPSWAHEWTKDSLPEVNTILTSSEQAILGDIVGTFIPKTDTLGAKELGVHQFINVMLTDCYPSETQQEFSKIINQVDKASMSRFKKSFTAITTGQRLELLKKLQQTKEIEGLSQIKEASIHGYLNSEYVMKNILKYELVPARFNGCFPVKNKN